MCVGHAIKCVFFIDFIIKVDTNEKKKKLNATIWSHAAKKQNRLFQSHDHRDGDFDQMTIKKVCEKEKFSPFYEYWCLQYQ